MDNYQSEFEEKPIIRSVEEIEKDLEVAEQKLNKVRNEYKIRQSQIEYEYKEMLDENSGSFVSPEKEIEVLHGITYEDYIEGTKHDGTLQFHFNDLVFTQHRKILKGTPKFICNFFIYAYQIFPLILVAFIAYKYNNWYLLFGILISYFSTFLTSRNIKALWMAPFLFFIWYWYKHGFHLKDYLTFFYLCDVWGGFFYMMATGCEKEYAKNEVLNNPELFNSFSRNGTIYFLRKK